MSYKVKFYRSLIALIVMIVVTLLSHPIHLYVVILDTINKVEVLSLIFVFECYILTFITFMILIYNFTNLISKSNQIAP